MSESLSEHSGGLSDFPKASPSVWAACRTFRQLLRALGEPVGMSESLSERWDGPSECPKVSPSVGMARRNVRKSLRALGRPVGMSDGFSEHWDGPSECPTAYFYFNVGRLLPSMSSYSQPVPFNAPFMASLAPDQLPSVTLVVSPVPTWSSPMPCVWPLSPQ